MKLGKVLGISGREGGKMVMPADFSMTTFHVIYANGHKSENLYIFKSNAKSLSEAQLQKLKQADPNGRFSCSPKGGMNKELWENVAVPLIIDSIPPEVRSHEWVLISCDGLDCHCMSPKALKMLWDARILLVQERAQNSEVLQALDISCFGPLSNAIKTAIKNYVKIFGNKNFSQFEFPYCYHQVSKTALSVNNIKSGFRKAGLYPLLSADQWLYGYGEDCGIKIAKRVTSAVDQKLYSRSSIDVLQSLNLSPRKRRLSRVLYRPPRHTKRLRTSPRKNKIDEPVNAAKLLNVPKGVSPLERVKKAEYAWIARLKKDREEEAKSKKKKRKK